MTMVNIWAALQEKGSSDFPLTQSFSAYVWSLSKIHDLSHYAIKLYWNYSIYPHHTMHAIQINPCPAEPRYTLPLQTV